MSGADLPPDPPDSDDPDRAAILARRKRFLAIALSGLASGIACAAQPCLQVAAPDDPNDPPDGNATAEPPSAPAEPIPDEVTPPVEPSPEPTPPRYTPPPPRSTAEPLPCLLVEGKRHRR